MNGNNKRTGLSESFIAGVIAIVFLLVGFQTALFIHRAAVVKIAADRDAPDTVYIYEQVTASTGKNDGIPPVQVRKDASHSVRVEAVRENAPRNRIENFRFNPNTVSVEELCRLGFTVRQAQSIDNYRNKGGRFRRKEDFARSYVVSDSVYRRLEPYIDIPVLDLNLADSAAFDALPGIGGWFASQMIAYRKALGGYSFKEQLMDIKRFDEEKFRAIEDLVAVYPENVRPYPLWSLPADSLQKHPYIGNHETARSVVMFRENTPKSQWTVSALESAGILSESQSAGWSRCRIADP